MEAYWSKGSRRVSDVVDAFVLTKMVPRPSILTGYSLCHFLQAYRLRADSDSICLKPDRLHIPCQDCDTPPRLILGCGTVHQDGWIGLDVQGDGADLLWDLQFPLPWPDNSVQEIVAHDILEHLEGWQEVLVGWIESLRVGGRIHVRVPDSRGPNALRDPTHVNLFSENSLDWLWDDEIYGAKKFRRGVVVELENREPRIPNDFTWNLIKLEESGP